MAKFLNTTGLSYHLELLINNSKEKLILISPYLKFNPKIKQLIEDKNRLKTLDIRIIFRKNELNPDENNWMELLDYVRTSFCDNLHAKCYMNEKEAIITSMNLYDFSQINNLEMGIYVSKEDDPELFCSINEEVRKILSFSEEYKFSAKKIPKNNYNKSKGFCIRCKAQIKLNPVAPYCSECYKIWNEYKNEEYIEKFCLICGKNNESTFLKPVCKECYKDNKKLFK
jgi:hypothetical protein